MAWWVQYCFERLIWKWPKNRFIFYEKSLKSIWILFWRNSSSNHFLFQKIEYNQHAQFSGQNLLCELEFQILWTPFTNKSFLHPRGILKCIERESQFFCWRGKNVDRLNPDVFVITCCNCILTHNHVSEWGERVEQGGDFQIKGAEWHFTWCVTWYIIRLCTFRNLLRIGEVHL